jgi:hypothetical protein
MSRRIPKFIGRMKVPETRSISLQLLRCLSDLLGETENIKAMFIAAEKIVPDHLFLAQCQDIAMYLGGIMDDRRMKRTREDLCFVGKPTSHIGHLNCKLASVLHHYFDEPGYVIGGKYPPVMKETIEEAIRREQEDKSPCPEPKPC